MDACSVILEHRALASSALRTRSPSPLLLEKLVAARWALVGQQADCGSSERKSLQGRLRHHEPEDREEEQKRRHAQRDPGEEQAPVTLRERTALPRRCLGFVAQP